MISSSNKILVLLGTVIAIAVAFSVILLGRIGTPIPKVAIVQDKPQEWADALKLGVADGLRQQGLTDGVDFVLVSKSAVGDPQGMTALAEITARLDFAAIYTLGTQSTQAIFRAKPKTPIVFGAVTDPVEAGLFEKNLSHPRGQITGTQDIWPYQAQFDLIVRLLPNAKKVGALYNASEINSHVSMRFVRDECKKRNLQLIEKTVTEESQVSAALAGLIDAGIDAFYIPADNTAQTSSRTIVMTCTANRIPVFTGISGIVENGAIGCIGTNYYDLGRLNATQIAKILRGASASSLPVLTAEDGDLYINISAARALGIEVPQELKNRAKKVYE